MPKRITIADVAREAGVSMMTVSRAINNKGRISEDTRENILKIAKEMGYQPSGLARALATNRSCTLGLIVPDVANPFFSQIARGVEDAAYASGFNVFLVNTDEDIEREEIALDSLLEKQVDGAILASSRLPQAHLTEYVRKFNEIVLINRTFDSQAVGSVATINVDDVRGAQIAIEHLARSGMKNIAYLAGPEGSASGKRRLDGYRLGLDASNLAFQEYFIVHCHPNTNSGYEAAKYLLNRQKSISAIFAYNDLIAIGAMQACDELGLHVPDDIAIIGVDDIPLATVVRPKLSTLRIDKHELGQLAMNTLIALIEKDENVLREQVIQPSMVLRESTP